MCVCGKDHKEIIHGIRRMSDEIKKYLEDVTIDELHGVLTAGDTMEETFFKIKNIWKKKTEKKVRKFKVWDESCKEDKNPEHYIYLILYDDKNEIGAISLSAVNQDGSLIKSGSLLGLFNPDSKDNYHSVVLGSNCALPEAVGPEKTIKYGSDEIKFIKEYY